MGKVDAIDSRQNWAPIKPGPFGWRYTLRDHRGRVVRPARRSWLEFVRDAPFVFWSLSWGRKLALLVLCALAVQLLWIVWVGSMMVLDGIRTSPYSVLRFAAVVSIFLVSSAIAPALFLMRA